MVDQPEPVSRSLPTPDPARDGLEGTTLRPVVEGFELDAIRGMVGTIADHHPTAVVEILDPSQIAAILALFGPGYRVYNSAEQTGELSEFAITKNKLFIHDDRVHLLSGYQPL